MTSIRLHAASRLGQLPHGGDQRARLDGAAGARRAGLLEQHERHRPLAEALLVARGGHHHRVGVDTVQSGRQAAAGEQLPHLLAQVVLPDSRSAASSPSATASPCR